MIKYLKEGDRIVKGKKTKGLGRVKREKQDLNSFIAYQRQPQIIL